MSSLRLAQRLWYQHFAANIFREGSFSSSIPCGLFNLMGCCHELLPRLDPPPPNCPLPLQKPQRRLANCYNEPVAPCPAQYYLTSSSCSPIWSHLLSSLLEKRVFLPQRLVCFLFFSFFSIFLQHLAQQGLGSEASEAQLL